MLATASETADLHKKGSDLAANLPGGAKRYEIIEKIAVGGMGEVYRGRHLHLERTVAIKVCLPGKEPVRFRREAQLLASVSSPHVVSVHDFDLLPDGRAILVMDWIDGPDLKQKLVDHPEGIPEAEVRRWMTDVCAGMQAAEEQHVVHRDLKPSNILLDRRTGRALVADFGLARSPFVDQLTSPDVQAMGTPYYMAPEQAEDPQNAGTCSDVYSFGATFYHLLTGQAPFTGATPFAVLYKHKTEPLISPRTRRKELSSWVSDMLERCMAKSPADRFGSFAALGTALHAADAQRSSWEFAEDTALRPYLDQFESCRPACLESFKTSQLEPICFTFPGNQKLIIQHGNIARQEVDAVVSSDDGWLSMRAGVSAAIRHAAGSLMVEAARQYVPVRAGRAVVTPGGKLSARFVFHGVTIDVASNQWICPSRDVIAEIMESCFYHADTLNVRSMAFPLLGTGTGCFPVELGLDTMFRFLARKFLHGLTAVREVRLMLY